MLITYDEQADAVYIRLVEGQQQVRNVCLTEQITLDFGPADQLVGIEIVDAKRLLGQGQLPKVVVDHLPVAAA